MLKTHLNKIELVLLAQSEVAKTAGHPNLRGGPREWFVADFLRGHLPSTLEIGQGEIIDSTSKPVPDPSNYRPQNDIVIYRRDLPKIQYSDSDYAFLSEGVMATVEVKSKLKREDVVQAFQAAKANKSLTRGQVSFSVGAGLRLPNAMMYLVAFDGPTKMKTIVSWLPRICEELESDENHQLDMIVLFGRGVI